MHGGRLGMKLAGRMCIVGVHMIRWTRPDRTLLPWLAAVLLGAVVALSLMWTQSGIHVSGLFALWCPPPASADAALGTQAPSCGLRGAAAGAGWLYAMVAGIFAGAGLSSFWRQRGLRIVVERGHGVRASTRLVMAAAGGLVVGIGSALAGGCTSSIGLTGSALLSVAAFVFLAVFFVGGFAARLFFGRFWNG
jgi:uncharacterized protein